MLQINSLSVQYGQVKALRDVSIRVEEGEFVGIVGPNGAGKSTLLNTMAGLLSPKSGSIELDGVGLQGRRAEAIVRSGIALVPQGRRIFGRMTVYENLQLGSTISKSSAGPRIDEVIDLFPILGEFRNRKAGHLSGGQQQQLAIARALLSEPRYLLLDEPSAGLSPLLVDAVFEVLGQLNQKGVAILLVEQAARRTIAASSRSYVLEHGQVRAEGTPDELLIEGVLEDAYMGRSASSDSVLADQVEG